MPKPIQLQKRQIFIVKNKNEHVNLNIFNLNQFSN